MFVVWIIIVVVGMTAAYLVIRDGEKRDETGKSKIEQSRTNKDNFYPFVFAALGGQSGGNSILFAKSIGEVMKTFTQVGFSATDAVISLFMGAGLGKLTLAVHLRFLDSSPGHITNANDRSTFLDTFVCFGTGSYMHVHPAQIFEQRATPL